MDSQHVTRRWLALDHLAQYYRRSLRKDLSGPIQLQFKNELVGYIDRISLGHGEMVIEGWARFPELLFTTGNEQLVVKPDFARPDVPARLKGKGFVSRLSAAPSLGVAVAGERIAQLDLLDRRDQLQALARLPGLFAKDCLRPVPAAPRHGSPPPASHNIFIDGAFAEPTEPSPVDIIIPVFEAHDDLARCLDQLARFTSDVHRVIIIDDASQDKRIADLLKSFARRRPNVQIIQRKQNKGFVKSVNRGLSIAKGHVVLLNSDAFVSEGWLPRLMAPLLGDASVASVSPMTNHGEILSVPVICRSSALSRDSISAAIAAARELHPIGATAEAPTGVGFCMAMSRVWLDRLPRFDRRFGRGYGEEVDWCQRARRMGGKNILTGAVFVEHKGAASFVDERQELISASAALLRTRYPNYDREVQEFIARDPMIWSRLVLALAAISQAGAERVPIYLGHRLGGGAAYWLSEEISARLASGGNAVVVRPLGSRDFVELEVHTLEGRTVGLVAISDLPKFLGFVKAKELVYSNLVEVHKPLKVMEAAVALLKSADRFRILMHDYFPLCPSHTLIGTNGRFCGLPDAKSCQACYAGLPARKNHMPKTILEWRDSWREWLEKAHEIIVFSKSSRELVAKVYPGVSGKLVLEPHKMPWLPKKMRPPRAQQPVVGILGNIGYQKGSAVLQSLAARKMPLKLVVIGIMDMAYHHPDILVHGPYQRGEIAELAARYGITKWLYPSVWPETYSYSVRECLATGLPVISFDLGAQSDAVREAANGILIPPDDEEQLVSALMRPEL